MHDLVLIVRFGLLYDFCTSNTSDIKCITLKHRNQRDIKYEYLFIAPSTFRKHKRFGERCWETERQLFGLRDVLKELYINHGDCDDIHVDRWNGCSRRFTVRRVNTYLLDSCSKRHTYVTHIFMLLGFPYDIADKITDEYVKDELVQRIKSVLDKVNWII